MSNVTPIRPERELTLDQEIHRLVESSRQQGELQMMARLHKLGVPMVLDNSVGMHEIFLALGRIGLTMTTIEDGVQLIHRQRDI